MANLTPPVVARAVQLDNSGFRSSATSPGIVPVSSRRLEFVGGQWVMFIPYQQGQTSMVVAWVPKEGYSAEADDEEHTAPPAGAPAVAPQAGVSGLGHSFTNAGGFPLQELQALIAYLQAIAAQAMNGNGSAVVGREGDWARVGEVAAQVRGVQATDMHDMTPEEQKAELGGDMTVTIQHGGSGGAPLT